MGERSPVKAGGHQPAVPRPPPVAAHVWRLLETPANTGARNMATDMALVDSVRAGGAPVLRFYRWWPPCISLGRHQPARGYYDIAEAERRGIDFVRRPTGGRAVYHHHEITYSVVVGDRDFGGPRKTYELIHKALLAGLRLLGANTDIVSDPGQRIRPSTVPCFKGLDGGAIVAGHRKLVGSAMLREKGVILQHGSLLLTGDQSPTVELLKIKRREDFPVQIAALDALLTHLPTWSELVDSLISGFERLFGIQIEESVLNPAETARTTELSRHFADPAWTWRL
ncbi:MAG: biotin/lipoate A/B protein ligase family protein [Gemmatimonadales bacterium]|jgi:lipoate-protein ligase A